MEKPPALLETRLLNGALIFIVAAFALTRLFTLLNIVDPDIWGHLRFGQDIFESRSIPRIDHYSYTAGTREWINHEWLSQLSLYTAYRLAGAPGLILFKLALFAGLVSLLFYALKLQTKSVLLKLVFLFTGLSVILPGFTFRPQIITYFLLPVLLILIERHEKTSAPGWLYALPAIFLLWCNFHGGFAAGLGILSLYTLSSLLRKKRANTLIAVTAASFAVTLANPYGARLWSFLYHAVTMPRPHVLEWGKVPLSFDFLPYFLLLALAAAGLIFSRKRRSLFEIIVLLSAALISLQHFRHTVLFALLAIMVIPGHIDSIIGERLLTLENRYTRILLIPVFIIGGLYFLLPLAKERADLWKIRIDESKFPVNAVDFIRQNGITGNMFCHLGWAQMCIRELPPGNRLFFDGRYDNVYSDEISVLYIETLCGKRDYKELLGRFPDTDIFFLDYGDALVPSVKRDPGWVKLYARYPAVIFVRGNERNRKVLENARNNTLSFPEGQGPFYFK